MKIRVSERHTKLSSDIRQGIKAKLEGLERYLDRIISIDAVVEKEKDHFNVRLVAHLVRKKIVKAEVQAKDLQMAVNEAVENLKGQLVRFKEQLKDHRAHADVGGEVEAGALEDPFEADAGAIDFNKVMRTEVHLRKPMTVAEALLQLDAHNRDLFLFDDAEGGGLRILHRHNDGQIELLEPKY